MPDDKAPEPKWGFDPAMQGAQIEHFYCPEGWTIAGIQLDDKPTCHRIEYRDDMSPKRSE
jgi:hypothetical protein